MLHESKGLKADADEKLLLLTQNANLEKAKTESEHGAFHIVCTAIGDGRGESIQGTGMGQPHAIAIA
jgi:hypothetical protein